MGGEVRPDGISAIAIAEVAVGVFFGLLFALNLFAAPLDLAPLVIGILFVGFGIGIWIGMPWAWYLLTFGGGFFGWYFARDDVKGFFGIEDHHDEGEYTGD